MISTSQIAGASRIVLDANVISPIHDVKCNERGCNTTILQVIGESIYIRTKHHGDHHMTIISIRDLFERYVA
jgi:hypothetical protein